MMESKNRQNEVIGKMVVYLIEENFPLSHLNALMGVITLFNHSKAAEEEVFIFAAGLYNKYSQSQPAKGADKLEPDNGMDAKASAIKMAQSLGLDDAIRTVAKSGNHVSGPNWYASLGAMDISATFGAGTNSTSVSSGVVKLYFASEYGRHIEIFHNGPWVHRIIAHANKLRRANEAQAKINEATKEKEDAAKFEEIDF